MAGIPYDPEYIARFYDEYEDDREWNRFDASPMDRVGLEVHRRLLGEFVRPGDRVLDAGAGPGRFTLELARLGATIVAGDISPRMLAEHGERTAEVEDTVEARELLDIVDLSRFADESFDAVVCYGGPLSYVLERAGTALDELVRVTRPGGYVLLSVMSLLGAARAYFASLPRLVEEYGWEHAVEGIFRTGVLPGDINRGHICRLYRWSDLERLFEGRPCRVVVASSANFLSVANEAWDDRFLDIEVEVCREPGAVDGGTHILAALERL